jgi:hypothetical protein
VERYKTLHGYFWRRRAAGRVQTAFFALAAIRRDVFLRVGGFDERLRDSEDVEFSARLLAHPDTRHLHITMTETVTGRHDDVDRLAPMLREQLRRSRLLPSMLLAQRQRAKDRPPVSPDPALPARQLLANRPATVLTGALTVAAVPVAALGAFAAAPQGLVPLSLVPLALLALFLASDPGLFRYAAAYRGWRFLPVFVPLHLLMQAAVVLGALLGALRPAPRPAAARHRRPVKAT